MNRKEGRERNNKQTNKQTNKQQEEATGKNDNKQPINNKTRKCGYLCNEYSMRFNSKYKGIVMTMDYGGRTFC
jgi:hypothetical protein